jgi:glycosyltransferase involved in cell wall biosynthesis
MIDKSISVFMPAYNEEDNIQSAVLEAEEMLKNTTNDYEIIVVNDGSTDSTKLILNNLLLKLPCLRVIEHFVNKGIAEAIKSGLFSAKKDLIFYNSADRQARMEAIKYFIPLMKDYDIVVGALRKRRDNLIRRISSTIYHKLISVLFGINLRNINALKLIKASAIEDILIESKSAFVDAEILIKANKAGYRITEVEIEHLPRLKGKQKGARLSTVLGTIRDLLSLYRKIR